MTIKIRIIFLLLFALLFQPALRATTLARLSLDQLAEGSDAVARVRCGRAESRWENGSIWTVTTFNVVESMKGALPLEIAVQIGRAHV